MAHGNGCFVRSFICCILVYVFQDIRLSLIFNVLFYSEMAHTLHYDTWRGKVAADSTGVLGTPTLVIILGLRTYVVLVRLMLSSSQTILPAKYKMVRHIFRWSEPTYVGPLYSVGACNCSKYRR